MSDVTSLPAIPSGLDPQLTTLLTSMKELLETREGQRRNSDLEKVVTFGDLASAGLYDTKTKSIAGKGGDNTPPQPPTGVVAFQRGTVNLVTWTNPPNSDLASIEVWASENTDTIDAAKLVGSVLRPTELFEHGSLRLKSTYTYWCRAVDTSDNKSTFSGGAKVGTQVDNVGTDWYDIFFGDLSKDPAVLRINAAITAIGAFYYENQPYYRGDVVVYGGLVYQATQDNPLVDGKSKPPTDPAYWKPMPNLADLSLEHETRIIQNTDEITLRATKSELQTSINQVNSLMTAQLSVMATQISAKVDRTDFNVTQQIVESNASKLELVADKISSQVSRSLWDLPTGKFYTFSSKVQQLYNAWTLSVQADGFGGRAVTGIDLALGDDAQGYFTVMANNFRVVSQGLSPKGLFAVKAGVGVYISEQMIADGGISTTKLAAGSITADKIAGGTITGDKIAGSTITGSNIRANSIWADDALINGTLSASKIAAGTITADKIAAGSITADKIAADTIDARVLKQNGIPIDKIAGGVILQVNTGATSCTLTQPGTHIYIVSASAWGRGGLTFSCSVGSQLFALPSYYGSGGEDAYPMLNFATGKAGIAAYSTATWVPGQGVNLDTASIVGFVIK